MDLVDELFHIIGRDVVNVEFGEWGGGEMRRMIFREAPHLHLSVIYGRLYTVLRFLRKKLCEMQSGIERQETVGRTE